MFAQFSFFLEVGKVPDTYPPALVVCIHTHTKSAKVFFYSFGGFCSVCMCVSV